MDNIVVPCFFLITERQIKLAMLAFGRMLIYMYMYTLMYMCVNFRPYGRKIANSYT